MVVNKLSTMNPSKYLTSYVSCRILLTFKTFKLKDEILNIMTENSYFRSHQKKFKKNLVPVWLKNY